MTVDTLRTEVDSNYDFFQRNLALLLLDHRDQYALIRACRIEGFFQGPGDAYRAGLDRFSDALFSIQQVTDEVEDLGFFSHAGA